MSAKGFLLLGDAALMWLGNQTLTASAISSE